MWRPGSTRPRFAGPREARRAAVRSVGPIPAPDLRHPVSPMRTAVAAVVVLATFLCWSAVWPLPAEAAPAGRGAGLATDLGSDPGDGLGADVERMAREVGLGEVDRLLAELDREMEGELPSLRVGDVIDMLVRREGAYTLSGFVKAVVVRLWSEVAAGSGLLARLVILALLCGLLENIQGAFARPQTSELAFGACYLVLIIMAVGAFLLAVNVCRGVIDTLVDFMQAMLPVLVTLLAGVGAVTTAGLFHPVLVASVELVATFIRDVILPVILCAASIDLVSRTFSGIRLTGLSEVLRQAAVAVTGLLMCVFLGVVTVYGAAGSVFDSASVRAAKFAAKTFIPFVGSFLSDAVDVVMSSSLVLKNVVGVVGAMAIVAYTVFPLLKVFSLVIVFRVAGAVVQPLGAGTLVESLRSVGGSLVLMMVTALAVAVMFLIMVAIVVGAATVTVAAR